MSQPVFKETITANDSERRVIDAIVVVGGSRYDIVMFVDHEGEYVIAVTTRGFQTSYRFITLGHGVDYIAEKLTRGNRADAGQILPVLHRFANELNGTSYPDATDVDLVMS